MSSRNQLNRSLRRALLNLGRKFDKKAACKALITNHNHHDMRLCSQLTKFLGPKKRLYVPQNSLEDFLKNEISRLVHNDTHMTKRFRILRQLNQIEQVFERIKKSIVEEEDEDDDEDDNKKKFIDLGLRTRRHKNRTAPGTVLISHPLQLADPSYRRKVMVLLSEDTTNGISLGVIVNGNQSRTSADRLIQDHSSKGGRRRNKRVSISLDDKTRDLLRKAPVYSGGPSPGVICLHRAPVCDSATLIFDGKEDESMSSRKRKKRNMMMMDGEVYYGGDTTKIAKSVASNSNEWKFFNGFCRFETSTLRHEIEEGSWIVCDAPSDLVMRKDVTWKNTLSSLGDEFDSFRDLADLDLGHFVSDDNLGYVEDGDNDDMFEEDGVF